ncbi:MAG: hypothetical protein IT368_16145 [Candidatus Hydrogenedentes bacterium]|nr:hypothetical protein [Candidatus Hydrogenedentota bacterium]
MAVTTADPGSLAPPVQGHGRLDRHNGIYVARLEGTWEEMGRQHAELAGAVCGDVVFRYLNGLIEKLIAHAVPALGSPGAALLKRLFHLRNTGRLGEELTGLMAGSNVVLGVNPAVLERAVLVPDILHYLAGRSFVPLAVPPMCSGVYATGRATQGGKQLICRNFDFFGRGIWNECNALVVMQPAAGQRICWISALGSPVGPQGFNESGLYFGLHTHFTRDVSTKGVPLFTLCSRVMSQCTSLDEAIAVITAEPRLCGLSLFLVDSRSRRAAVVGFSAGHHEVVYPEEDVLVRCNHYTTAPMQRHEVAPHPWQRNSRGRFRRIHELIGARRGSLAAEDMTAILGDCVDVWEGRTRVTGNIVACANTTQSLVLSPDEDTLWLAKADHPVSHASHYAGFSIRALLEGDVARYEREPLPGGCTLDATQRAALHEYECGWSAYFDHLDTDESVFRLRRAAELLPDEPIFPRMAGLLLLKQKRFLQALPLLEENARLEYQDVLMKAEAHLWLGRCHDLMGRRAEALVAYRQAAALNAYPVSGAAARHCTRPFRKRELFDVAPEFIVGTALARYRQN